jgi:hypothetical protein
MPAMMPRLAAAIIAIVCWAGLAIQFSASYANHVDLISTLWSLGRFFTILTNLLLAVTMTWVAVGGSPSVNFLGGVTLSILLVGIVYVTLLQGLHVLTGAHLLADTVLHKVTPVLTALWWLLFAPRAKLRWNAALWWIGYPLAYLVYVLARGQLDHKYPYPFLDVARIGWMQTALNIGGIALGFMLAGFLLVWIDSWRPLGSGRSSR